MCCKLNVLIRILSTLTSQLILLLLFLAILMPTANAVDSQRNSRQEYMRFLSKKISRHWIPPESTKKVEIKLSWKINRDGTISNLRLLSKNAVAGKAAMDSVRAAAPFDKLPADAKDAFEIEYSFVYEPNLLGLTVPAAVQKYGPDTRKRWAVICKKADVPYPPTEITLLAFKEEYQLYVFASDKKGKLKQLQCYEIQGASGKPGPKLKEGDLQVPEGFYKIDGQVAWKHLALSVNYPNQFDRSKAAEDGRSNLGGYIQIHGGNNSTGCLAIGEEAIEDLFILAHDAGPKNLKLIICPCNFLKKNPDVDFKKQPNWLPLLYEELRKSIKSLCLQPGFGTQSP